MSRCIRNISVCVLAAFLLALVPYCANLRYPIDCQPLVSVVRSEALATTEGTDFGYIQQCAMNAGVSESEYIANTIFLASAASGVNFANENGVNYNYTPEQNLKGIIPSRDFPEWTGSDSQVTAYGNELNYNAARFNSLMITYGKIEPEDYSDYKANPSGYQVRTNVRQWLENVGTKAIDSLGSVGGMLLGTVKSLFGDKDVIEDWLPSSDSGFIDASNVTNWPSSLPVHFEYSYSNIGHLRTSSYYYTFRANQPVYMFCFNSSSTSGAVEFTTFNQTNYMYGEYLSSSKYNDAANINYNAGQEWNDSPSYFRQAYAVGGTYQTSDVPFYNVRLSSNEIKIVRKAVMFGVQHSGGETPEIVDYPDDASSNTLVIFPGGGFADSTPWQDIISNQQIMNDNVQDIVNAVGQFGFDADGCLYTFDKHLYNVAQNFNFYVSGNNSLLRVYDEQLLNKANQIYELMNRPTNQQVNAIVGDFDWPQYKAESQQFQASLQDVAPFCSIWLAKMVVDQIALADPVADAKFEMPFGFFGESNHIAIDLNFLDAARPFFNFFTIALLVLSLARGTMHFLNSELV